jgi:HEAT repeat protein
MNVAKFIGTEALFGKTLFIIAIYCIFNVLSCSSPSIKKQIIILISSDNSKERNSAAEDLAKYMDHNLVSRIVGLSQSNSFAKEGLEIMADFFEETAKTANVKKGCKAVKCIAQIKSDRSILILGNLLQGDASMKPPTEVRRQAALALGEIGSSTSIASLIHGLESPFRDEVVVSTIQNILVSMKITAVKPLIDEKLKSPSIEIEDMLVRIGRPAIQPLVSMLNTNEDWVIDSLARIGRLAAPFLIEKMNSDDKEIRSAAALSLVRMGKHVPDVTAPFLEILEKGDLQKIAEIYPFFIRLGREGTESILASSLYDYGTKTMCLDYLNCGNNQLKEAGEKWANRHGYSIFTMLGSHGGPKWGEGL